MIKLTKILEVLSGVISTVMGVIKSNRKYSNYGN